MTALILVAVFVAGWWLRGRIGGWLRFRRADRETARILQRHVRSLQ